MNSVRLVSALALVAACHHHGPPSAPPLQVAAPPAGSSIRVQIPADGSVCLPSPTPGMMFSRQGAVAPDEAAAECHAVRGDTAPAGEWRFVISSAASGHTLTCDVGECSSPPVSVVAGGLTSRGIVVSKGR